MKLSHVLPILAMASSSVAAGFPDRVGSDHLVYSTYTTEHVTILSNRTFNATRTALETAIPLLDYSYKAKFAAGDTAGAKALLEALPPLNRFYEPKNHGILVSIYGLTRQALLYDIGNPYTASKMTRYRMQCAQHAPVRVLLIEYEDGRVAFEWDRPASTFGRFGDPDVDVTAYAADDRFRIALLTAAGWCQSPTTTCV